jgi:hypothetical protein
VSRAALGVHLRREAGRVARERVPDHPPREKTTAVMTATIAAINKPYSTAEAPTSRRLLTASRAGVPAGEAAAHCAAGLAERAVDELSETEHDTDDHGGDGGHHEAVLHRGGATIAGPAAHLAEVREHRGFPSVPLGERIVLEEVSSDTTVRVGEDPSRSVKR